jgi:hypothetical protein
VDERRGAPRLPELLERGWSQGLKGIATTVVQLPGPTNRWTALVRAAVETDRGAFSGLGEASAGEAGPGPEDRLVEEAEARAVARALGWATNSAPAVAARRPDEESAPPPPARAGVDPASVPAWLRVEDGGAQAGPPAGAAGRTPEAEPGQPGARRPTDRAGRVLATAQSLRKACAARGIAAPEPDPGWDEARLQEYVATWSSELRQAAAPDRAPRP